MKHEHSLLVVDDELGVVESVYDLFRLDYDVYKAISAEQALQVMQENEIHVVMTDQRMPFMSGVELLATIKGKHPDAIRLLFTGFADIHAVIEAINQGSVFRYIVKPWDPEELRSVVRQAGEQYELIIERRELLEKLRSANELKGNFIAIASHELNTPTFIVMGMAKLAERLEEFDPKQTRACLEAIRRASERLERIVTNMLRLVSAEDFNLEASRRHLALTEIEKEVRKELGPFLEVRNITLAVDAEPGISLVANPDMIEDVVENLVSNAIRFSPDGSTITLKAHRADGLTRLEVIDQGTGIAEEDMPHVFEAFFTSRDVMHHHSGTHEFGSRGIGLGLTVAKKLVELHQGTIRIESSRGQGTRVIVMLPNIAAPVAAVHAARQGEER